MPWSSSLQAVNLSFQGHLPSCGWYMRCSEYKVGSDTAERTKKAAQMKTFFLLSGCASSGKTEILPHTQPLFICEMGRLIIPGLYAMSFPHRRFRIGECFLPQDSTSVSIPPQWQNTWRNQLGRRMNFVYSLLIPLLWVCGSSVPHGRSIKQKNHLHLTASRNQ